MAKLINLDDRKAMLAIRQMLANEQALAVKAAADAAAKKKAAFVARMQAGKAAKRNA